MKTKIYLFPCKPSLMLQIAESVGLIAIPVGNKVRLFTKSQAECLMLGETFEIARVGE